MIIMSADRTVAVNSNQVQYFLIGVFSEGNKIIFRLMAQISDTTRISLKEYDSIKDAQNYFSRLVNILGDEYNGVEVVQ